MIITPQLWLPKRYRQKPEKVGKWMDFPLKRDGRILPNLGNYLGDDRFRRLMAAWSPAAATLNAAVIHYSGSDTTPGSNQSETSGRLQQDYELFNDSFGSNVNYFTAGNGEQADGWTLANIGDAPVFDANITNAGKMTISPTSQIMPWTNISRIIEEIPKIYRKQTSSVIDVDASCNIATSLGDYDAVGIAVEVRNTLNTIFVLMIFISDYGGTKRIFTNGWISGTQQLNETANDANYGQTDSFFRIYNNAGVLTAQYKKLVGDSWITSARTVTISGTVKEVFIYPVILTYYAGHQNARFTFDYINGLSKFSTSAITATSIFTDPTVTKLLTYNSFITFLDNDAVTAGTLTAQCKDKTTGGAAGNIGASTSITTDGQSIDLSAVTPKDEFQFDMAQLSTTGASRGPCPTTNVLLYGPIAAAAGGARGCWL